MNSRAVADLPVTSVSEETRALLAEAVHAYLEYRLSAGTLVKAALVSDPDCAMAHVMRGLFMMLLGSVQGFPAADKAIAEAERTIDGATAREAAHLAALKAWRSGQLRQASLIWEQILADTPTDLLALRLHHFNAFWQGNIAALCALPAASLPSLPPGSQSYGFAAAMLAFGLEEAGDHPRAEAFGRAAVALNPNDLWAIHAVAHVLEMSGRVGDGIAWFAERDTDWSDRNPFREHLHWHHTLFQLETGAIDVVLDLFDRHIQVDPNAGFYLDIQNGASLLLRLELLGHQVGERWQALAEVSARRIDDRTVAFTDPHAMMSLARSGRTEDVAALMNALETHARAHGDADPTARLLADLCSAIAAFGEGDWDRTVTLLTPIRHSLSPIGGSHAQRDVFAQILLTAAIKGGQIRRARQLLCERETLRPASVFDRWAATALSTVAA